MKQQPAAIKDFVAKLTAVRDRILQYTEQIAKLQAENPLKPDEKIALEQELKALREASPVRLVSLGLTPAQAAKRVDDLQGKLASSNTLTERQRKVENERDSAKRELLGAALDVCLEARKRVLVLLGAVILSWTHDKYPRSVLHDITHGELRPLLASSAALREIDDRQRRLKHFKETEDLLRIASEILTEPVPPLARREVTVTLDDQGYLHQTSS